MPVVAW
jgi:hypothetical protein